MTRYICVSSGKGGVGKTTTAVNLASSMQKQGNDVVLVDGNVSTPHIHLHLGGEKVDRHLHHAIRDEIHISQLIYKHNTGLRVVPAHTELEHLKYPDHEGFKDSLLDLEGFADTVIVDCAPGFGREAVVPLEVTDEVLIVTTPDHAAVDDALRTLEVARELGKPVLGVVLNMVRKDRMEHKIDEVEEALGVPVIAVIPHDKKVRSALRKQQPVVHAHSRSKASKKFLELAGLLIGPSYADKISKEKDKGLEGYVRKQAGLKK